MNFYTKYPWRYKWFSILNFSAIKSRQHFWLNAYRKKIDHAPITTTSLFWWSNMLVRWSKCQTNSNRRVPQKSWISLFLKVALSLLWLLHLYRIYVEYNYCYYTILITALAKNNPKNLIFLLCKLKAAILDLIPISWLVFKNTVRNEFVISKYDRMEVLLMIVVTKC